MQVLVYMFRYIGTRLIYDKIKDVQRKRRNKKGY